MGTSELRGARLQPRQNHAEWQAPQHRYLSVLRCEVEVSQTMQVRSLDAQQ